MAVCRAVTRSSQAKCGDVSELPAKLVAALAGDVDAAISAWWSDGDLSRVLEPERIAQVDALTNELRQLTQSARSAAGIGDELSGNAGRVVLAWLHTLAGERAQSIGPLLTAASQHADASDVARLAQARVAAGPLFDALSCLPYAGPAGWLANDDIADAKLDLLIWEAGGAALSLTDVGQWLWSDDAALERCVLSHAQGNLRDRCLAARWLSVAAAGMPMAGVPIQRVVATQTVVHTLAAHPEPLIWIPAVCALGRLASRIPELRLELLGWLDSDRIWQRRRAVTALASAAATDPWLTNNIDALLESKDPWLVAAIGPAAPYLARECAEQWEQIAERLLADHARAEVLWSTTQGMLPLVRREQPDGLCERVLRAARDHAGRAVTSSSSEAQLWEIIKRDTDFLDNIDPDPSFPDVLLDRICRDAVRLGPAKVHRRAAQTATSIGATFDSLVAEARQSRDRATRSHALAAVEACTRAATLRLWQPILRAAGQDTAKLSATMDEVCLHMGELFALELSADELDYTMRRSALRVLSNLIDGTPAPNADTAGSVRGRTAARALAALANSKWARNFERSQLRRFRKPITDLLWRLADALNPRDEAGASTLAPLGAWWVVSTGSIEFMHLLKSDSEADQERIVANVQTIRDAFHSGSGGAHIASWCRDVMRSLHALSAGKSVMAYAMSRLFGAMSAAEFALLPGREAQLSEALQHFVEPLQLLAAVRLDPNAALSNASEIEALATPDLGLLDIAARAVDSGEPTPEQVASEWCRHVGPLLRPVVQGVVRDLVSRQRQLAELRDKRDRLGPYRKLKRLGGGGQGEVWLVKREGPRRFVLKLPNSPMAMSPGRRDEFKRLLEREAKLLEGIHEAKLAAFCDWGWDGDTPYLVLQYLIGADLERYASVRLLTMAELKPIVRDVCLGLRALHERGIVHRDLKPSNVFLRLQLPQAAEEQFDVSHREPAVARISEAVLIDFGISKTIYEPATSENAAEGTLGYMSPEQAESDEHVTAKSDIYGLAATVYRCLTGHTFFEEKTSKTPYLVAHAFEHPFANERVRAATASLPPALIGLLTAATDLDAEHRPDVDSFAERFAVI